MDPAALAAIACKHGIVLVVRFGSTVTGRTHAASDVDLAVLFERFPSMDAELEAIADLGALGSTQPVDVAVLNHADPLLLKQVATGGRLEYGTPARFDAFRRYAFKRYHDHAPYFAMEREYVARVFSRTGE